MERGVQHKLSWSLGWGWFEGGAEGSEATDQTEEGLTHLLCKLFHIIDPSRAIEGYSHLYCLLYKRTKAISVNVLEFSGRLKEYCT